MINSVIVCLFLLCLELSYLLLMRQPHLPIRGDGGSHRGDLGLPAFLCLGGPLGLRAGGRGARRRRNKGLRGEAHHARAASGPSGLRNVVLGDEGTRACGERRTTPGPPADPIVRGTWCSSTKEQGLAGRGAPRPARRGPIAALTGPERTNRLDQQKEILLQSN